MKKEGFERSCLDLHANVPPDWYFRSIRENVLQKYWHKKRFEEVSKLIEPVTGIVLDIGSADGVFTKIISEKTKSVKTIGIDILERSVNWANKHWKSSKIKFIVSDAEKLNFKENSFDAVFALEVLEHVHSPFKILLKIRKILKKGGYGIFLVPTDSTLFRVVWFFWTKLRGKIWKETHIQTFRNNYLPNICKRAGFKIEVNKFFALGMLQAIKVRKI